MQLGYLLFISVSFLRCISAGLNKAGGEKNANTENEEGVFNIRFGGTLTNTPQKHLMTSSLTGISINIEPSFWSVKGSFYFCVSSKNSYALDQHHGLHWKKNNRGYSSFSLFNFTLYESGDDENLLKEEMVFNHGPTNETEMLESLVTDLVPYDQVRKRYCYLPDPWSLISDERELPNKYRIEKFLSGTYYFDPIQNAVIHYGAIPFIELLGDWKGPLHTKFAPMHLVVTSNMTEAFTMEASSSPVALRAILPRCVEFGLQLRCFTYFYSISTQDYAAFGITFHNANQTLDFPTKGDESAYILVNHHSAVFDSKTLTKREPEQQPGHEEMLSFCTYNVKDLEKYDQTHASFRSVKLSHIATLRNSGRPLSSAAASIYQGTQNIMSFAIGMSYGAQIQTIAAKWVGTEPKLPTFHHQIHFNKKFLMNCRLLIFPPENLPIRLTSLKRFRKPRNFLWFLEPKLEKKDDFMSVLYVSRIPHIKRSVPRQGLAEAIHGSSRFMRADLSGFCNADTIIEVENPKEFNEYIESDNLLLEFNNETNTTCSKFFVPLNGSYLSPSRLDLYAYRYNETRPKLIISGASSIYSGLLMGLVLSLTFLTSIVSQIP